MTYDLPHPSLCSCLEILVKMFKAESNLAEPFWGFSTVPESVSPAMKWEWSLLLSRVICAELLSLVPDQLRNGANGIEGNETISPPGPISLDAG